MEQRQTSEKKNKSFFLEHHHDYKSKVIGLATYRNIFEEVSTAIDGAKTLIDVGNGGVFDYDTERAKHIIAVDLIFTSEFKEPVPRNCEVKLGSALDLPIPDGSANVVLMNMLLHHLTGQDVGATRHNLAQALAEAARVLEPGGKLVIMESCVPRWFFNFEKLVYTSAVKVIERTLQHPPTLQFPTYLIEEMLRKHFVDLSIKKVPKGSWVIQYGYKWPSILTPAQPFIFVARKS